MQNGNRIIPYLKNIISKYPLKPECIKYVRLRINMIIMFKTENQWMNKMELIFMAKENEDFLVWKD